MMGKANFSKVVIGVIALFSGRQRARESVKRTGQIPGIFDGDVNTIGQCGGTHRHDQRGESKRVSDKLWRSVAGNRVTDNTFGTLCNRLSLETATTVNARWRWTLPFSLRRDLRHHTS